MSVLGGLCYPNTAAGSLPTESLALIKPKVRFHKCKGEKQDGDVADRGVRLMGGRGGTEISAGSSGEPAKIRAVDRLK